MDKQFSVFDHGINVNFIVFRFEFNNSNQRYIVKNKISFWNTLKGQRIKNRWEREQRQAMWDDATSDFYADVEMSMVELECELELPKGTLSRKTQEVF